MYLLFLRMLGYDEIMCLILWYAHCDALLKFLPLRMLYAKRPILEKMRIL